MPIDRRTFMARISLGSLATGIPAKAWAQSKQSGPRKVVLGQSVPRKPAPEGGSSDAEG